MAQIGLDYITEGLIRLYHRSSNPDLCVADPSEAIKHMKPYSQKEFIVWGRPRVFFFLSPLQKDACGISIGDHIYKAEVPLSNLYPIKYDPLNYIGRPSSPFSNKFEQAAYYAEIELGCIGFIYPQRGTFESNIAAIWTPVILENLSADTPSQEMGP